MLTLKEFANLPLTPRHSDGKHGLTMQDIINKYYYYIDIFGENATLSVHAYEPGSGSTIEHIYLDEGITKRDFNNALQKILNLNDIQHKQVAMYIVNNPTHNILVFDTLTSIIDKKCWVLATKESTFYNVG